MVYFASNPHGRMHSGWSRHSGLRRAGCSIGILLCLVMLSACGSVVTSASNRLAENLAGAIADHDDPVTVEAGGPAYLLMVDAMVRGNPDDPELLTRAAGLYSAYAGAFVLDPVRSRKLTAKAFEYAQRAVCRRDPANCNFRTTAYDRFEQHLARMSLTDVPSYFALGAAWAAWIQARKDDLDAVAELARVEALMQRVLDLDETHMQGRAHLYLGGLSILLPPALGGRPDAARHHFERAIVLSNGRNLMVKVVYARLYARMLYDRALHDRLLQEVLAADPRQPGYVLMNTMAQQQARQLLDTATDYF